MAQNTSVGFLMREQRVYLDPLSPKHIFSIPKSSIALKAARSWRSNHQGTLQTTSLFLLKKYNKILCVYVFSSVLFPNPWKSPACCWNALKEGRWLIKILLLHCRFLSVFQHFCWKHRLILIACQKEQQPAQGISDDIWWCKNCSSWGILISCIKAKSDGWMKVCCLRRTVTETCTIKAIWYCLLWSLCVCVTSPPCLSFLMWEKGNHFLMY